MKDIAVLMLTTLLAILLLVSVNIFCFVLGYAVGRYRTNQTETYWMP